MINILFKKLIVALPRTKEVCEPLRMQAVRLTQPGDLTWRFPPCQ